MNSVKGILGQTVDKERDSLNTACHYYMNSIIAALTFRVCACTWSCPILWDPMDCNPPGSSVHGILWARIQELVAISFSRGSSRPRDWTCVSCVSCIGRWVLYQLSHQGSPWIFYLPPLTLHQWAIHLYSTLSHILIVEKHSVNWVSRHSVNWVSRQVSSLKIGMRWMEGWTDEWQRLIFNCIAR